MPGEREADNSVGMDVAWSVKGFSAKIKSRLFSSADKLGSRKLDEQGLETDRRVALHQALTGSQVAIIAAATKALETHIANDPKLAQRALTALSRASEKMENVEASFAFAVEDIRNRENASRDEAGPDEINSEMLARWQHYAEGATTDVLRERWGRVLAGEIRTPGTFSMKALRVIDELDPAVAKLFETFCIHRISNWLPTSYQLLGHNELSDLDEAGLISNAEFPQTIGFSSTKQGDSTEWWILHDNRSGVVVRKDAPLTGVKRDRISMDDIRVRDGVLSLNIVALTSVGQLVSSLIPYDSEFAFRKLAERLQMHGAPEEVKYIQYVPGKGFLDDEGLLEEQQISDTPESPAST